MTFLELVRLVTLALVGFSIGRVGRRLEELEALPTFTIIGPFLSLVILLVILESLLRQC